MADLVSPNKSHDTLSYEGWAYCARTPDRNVYLAYFEKGAPQAKLRAARLDSLYRAQWFDPREGTWSDGGELRADKIGIVTLPPFPSDADWGLRLVYAGPAPRPQHD